MKQVWKKTMAVFVSAGLLLGNGASALAQEKPVDKEENVYANLKADGSVSGVYVVNGYQLDKKETITDYGKYESVKNLSSDTKIGQKEDKITVAGEKGKFYYQGNLKEKELPWEVSIQYVLEGKEVSAREIAGKSGETEIHIQTKAVKTYSDFTENYLLQITATLSGKHFSDVQAEGAMQANVSGEKQLTYTVIPGQDADIEIRGKATDFEMDSIVLKAVPLSFDVKEEQMDTGVLKEKENAFLSGVEQLNAGSHQLAAGISGLTGGGTALSRGLEQLGDGADSLDVGAAALAKGSSDLKEGAKNWQSGLAQVAGNSQQMQKASAQIAAGLTKLEQQLNGQGGEELQLTEAIGAVGQLTEQFGTLVQASAQLGQGISNAYNTGLELEGARTAQDGLAGQSIAANEAAAAQLAQLEDSPEKTAAIQALTNSSAVLGGYQTLGAGYGQLVAGLGQLSAGYQGENGIQKGLEQTQQALQTMNQKIQTLGSTQEKLAALRQGVHQLYAAYCEGNQETPSFHQAVIQYTDGTDALYQSYSHQLYPGIESVAGGMETLDQGAGSLKAATWALRDGSRTLLNGLGSAESGAAALQEGTAALQGESNSALAEAKSKLEEIKNKLTGEGFTPRSFVSEKNTHVKAVQFVAKTEAIGKTKEKDGK
ncbi:hypothetical protein FYJ34_02970 [Clostridiaceae bacterium 68-1-5]|uniref:Uncharacterized protein n=1 Tax=Suipraeoptans intestinalis TaxID=2606628 RepID=A0A6N7V089_9FIRM|nr:hypothetical protein [Suipraeoptans intestinalis]MSR93256.1 hypothetical protein [Suipraeoptans intestinalis]